MKHYSSVLGEYVLSKKVDDFLVDIVGVYRKHGLSLAHQDGHGAFLIDRITESNIRWLNAAILESTIGDEEKV